MKFQKFQSQIENLKLEEILAYETGVHLGDGSLQKLGRVHRVIYCGDIENDYKFYAEMLPVILQMLYNKKPLVYKRKSDNTVLTILNSKEVVQRKIKLGLPVGNKIKLKIPKWVKRENLIPHFIRGLADADFCLSFKKNRKGIHCEPRIEFFTNNKVLAKFSYNCLRKLGFKVAFEDAKNKGFNEYRLRIYGKSMLKKWNEIIGFYNPKQFSKVMLFEKLGYFPINLSTNERLKML